MMKLEGSCFKHVEYVWHHYIFSIRYDSAQFNFSLYVQVG